MKPVQSFPRQLRDDGSLQHLITLEGLDRDLIERLLKRAQQFIRPLGAPPMRSSSLGGVTVANLFGEPSTRTRGSFELAARRLGADVVNLEVHLSSRSKGETVLDTVYTLQAMQIDVMVMREAEPGVPGLVARHVDPHVSVLSAGEAHLSHPTQGLLDALTIRQRKGGFGALVVAIVGDVAHSRVARSTAQALQILGVGELRIVAPAGLMPPAGEFAGARRFEDIDSGIRGADVVMMLRIQKERIADTSALDDAAYFRQFGLTPERLKLAKSDAIVMHPGPMNRGIEIDSSVADGPQSVIRQQVTNGVAVRMAVLEAVTEGLRRLRQRA
ncbi:MAG TPA: aspartate carbamoyltransferase catalytic subunit [Steroidobacteraceae bacterium]|nr:aspartate carbamoyltransferase catalytic subunit [Steroidobacteraceae bacterium]